MNKGITNISYNSLSLPQVVTFSNGNTITYLYTADGRKLRTVHVINGTATTTDYCGNVIYENGTQKLLLTEEGYVDLVNSNTYYYYLKDHQGNNRVVVSSSGTVMETNHYYPFGGVFSTSNIQPYKYNGKELDTKNGLNWYDYGARHYDAAFGRWFAVDPLAEKMYAWSPYGYCFNNPVKFVDEDGEFPWLALVSAAIDYGFQVYDNYQQGKSGYDAWVGDVNFVSVGLSAVNPAGKCKLVGTILIEGAKETFSFTPNNGPKIKSDTEEIITNTIENTVVSIGSSKLIESSNNNALSNVNKEMRNANQDVKKAQNKVNRNPNSEKAQKQLDYAKSNANQVRVKQVTTKILNSTIGEMNSDIIEQTITTGVSRMNTNYNWNEKEKKWE